MTRWKQFKDYNAIRSIKSKYRDCYFCMFNNIKVEDVLKYLNDNDVKTEEEAWKYINTLTDTFKCNQCGKTIPYKVDRSGGIPKFKICLKCKEKNERKYKRDRTTLIGKTITYVRWTEEGGLIIDLDNNKSIVIEDGEYGDDCSNIIKTKEAKDGK